MNTTRSVFSYHIHTCYEFETTNCTTRSMSQLHQIYIYGLNGLSLNQTCTGEKIFFVLYVAYALSSYYSHIRLQ